MACLLVAGLSGCAKTSEIYPYDRMAPMAPPEPIIEFVPRAEDPTTEIWRPGYWAYDGVAFHWVQGALVPRPDPTAVWGPDRWELRNYGWAFIPGRWL